MNVFNYLERSVYSTALKWMSMRAKKTGSFSLKDPAFASWFSPPTHSKVTVNEDTAMNYSAVYAAIRVISETMGSLPVKLIEINKSGTHGEVTQHPVADIFRIEPNEEMTPMVFTETQQGHVLTHGNLYSEIRTNGKGEAEQLHILHPRRVRVVRNEKTKKLEYKYTPENGSERTLQRDQVFHVPGFGGDGITGWSPIRLMRETIGMGLAAEGYGSSFFGNAARPSGVIQVDKKFKDVAQMKQMKKDVEEMMGAGFEKTGNVSILPGGSEWKAMSISPDEAQFLQTRKFQITEIARWYRIPPHMLGDLERATYSNIEQQSLDFEKFTLRPWLVRWKQEAGRKLFSKHERGRFYLKYIVEGLLSSDIKTRFEAYKTGIMNGWMNADEIRAKEDMNPLPDKQGQVYLIPQNMTPAITIIAGQDDDKEKKMRSSHRDLLAETFERVLSRESNTAKRAAKKPDSFNNWIDDYYEKHSETAKKLVTPALKLVCEYYEFNDFESFLTRLVDSQLVEESRQALLTASEVKKTEFESSINETVVNWSQRSADLADYVLTEVESHAKTKTNRNGTSSHSPESCQYRNAL